MERVKGFLLGICICVLVVLLVAFNAHWFGEKERVKIVYYELKVFVNDSVDINRTILADCVKISGENTQYFCDYSNSSWGKPI